MFAIPGRYSWCQSTQGLLSRANKANLLAQLLLTQCHEPISRLLSKKIVSERLATLAPAPDSVLAKQALEQARAGYSAPFFGHVQRCWLFAQLIAQTLSLDFDAEHLFVATLMHDLALPDQCGCSQGEGAFQVAGAQRAYELMLNCGEEQLRAEQLYETISYHLNLWLPKGSVSNEARLLKLAAHLDVVGAYHHYLHPQELQQAHQLWPRQGFRQAIEDSIQGPGHHANSHAGFLRSLGFAKFAAANPLNRFS